MPHTSQPPVTSYHNKIYHNYNVYCPLSKVGLCTWCFERWLYSRLQVICCYTDIFNFDLNGSAWNRIQKSSIYNILCWSLKHQAYLFISLYSSGFLTGFYLTVSYKSLITKISFCSIILLERSNQGMCVQDKRNAYKSLVLKLEGKKLLGRKILKWILKQ